MRINERAIKEPLAENDLENLFHAGRVRVGQHVAYPPREGGEAQWCLLSPVLQQGDRLPALDRNSADAIVKYVDSDNYEYLLDIPFFGIEWPRTIKGCAWVPDRRPLEWQITHVLTYDEEMYLRNLGYVFLDEIE